MIQKITLKFFITPCIFYNVTWRQAPLIGNDLIPFIKYNLWLIHEVQNILTVSSTFPQIKTLQNKNLRPCSRPKYFSFQVE